MKLLNIENDKDIISFLTRRFQEDGYLIESAINGEDGGGYLASVNSYDVIIIDWMLPSKNGIEIIKSLREKNIVTPLIMLSAKGEIEHKIEGLQYGADDYLSKPFSFAELEARVAALYRRSVSQGVTLLHVGEIRLN